MHEITINLDTLLWIIGFIAAVCGLIVYMKKGADPILRPFREMQDDVKILLDRKAHCDKKFEHDQEQLAELRENHKMMMESLMLLLKHAETGNCTGEVAEGRKKMEQYLISK